MAKKKKKQNSFIYSKYFHYTIKIAIVVISFLAILKQGFLGSLFSTLYYFLLGSLYNLYAIGLIALIIYSFVKKKQTKLYGNKYVNSVFILLILIWMITSTIYLSSSDNVKALIGSGALGLQASNTVNGGLLGLYIVGLLYMLIGKMGMYILIIISLFALIIYAGFSYREKIFYAFVALKDKIKQSNDEKKEVKEKVSNNEDLSRDNTEIKETPVVNEVPNIVITKDVPKRRRLDSSITKEQASEMRIHREEQTEIKSDTNINVNKNPKTNYIFPNINHLKSAKVDTEIDDKLEKIAKDNAKLLETTLNNFNIKAKVSDIHIGPNITKYEVVPNAGVKVSKFSGISNDLAMALAAKSIRVEAPIPGKAAVGIEIPNKYSKAVLLKDLLLENESDKLLQVPLGKDISGKTRFMEVNKTPHMLVAGATGSGKSVFINSMIISLLYKATSNDLKMIMIDPKKVELAPYNGIPHLLTPVVTDPKRAAVILKKMVAEMEYRYELFAKTNTRNIEGYNKKVELDKDLTYNKFPYILIIIDELADLMMVASNEVETSIARLAQMARAAGIHLVIATQRPSTDVITGLIKSNIPTRLSFSVSSSIDSRTILDASGAEKLLGKGDMLYSANGENELIRIQACYLSDEEIISVVNDIIENNEIVEEKKTEEQFEMELNELEEYGEMDELYQEAKELVIKYQRASTSLLQRELKVGFNRASKIMDQLEETNIISASEGTKPRKVLVSAAEEGEE